MDFVKCRTFPQIKIARYIIIGDRGYSSGGNFALLELIGRPTVIQAALATIIGNKELDAEQIEGIYYHLSKGKNNRLVLSRQTKNQLSVVTVQNSLISDLFVVGDNKKFMEALRKQVHIPVADEWGDDLYKILKKQDCLEPVISNIGEYAMLDMYKKSKIEEYIKQYISNQKGEYEAKEIPQNIGAFVEAYAKPLTDMLYKKVKVVYSGEPADKIDYSTIINNGFIPYPQQADVANAVVKRLQTAPVAFIAAEMGCGKTLMSLMTAYGMYKKTGKGQRLLLMLPPHLVEKWIREAKKAYGETLLQKVSVISRKADVDELRKSIGTKPVGLEVYIVPREMAKLSYYWRPIKAKKEDKFGKAIVNCPKCDMEQVIAKTAKSYCKHVDSNGITCGEPLWQAVESIGNGKQIQRVSVMEYMKKYLPSGFFDLFILDEAHEEKGESARGVAAAQAAKVSKKALLLTGTLSGGKPSTLFYLLYRFYTNSIKDIVAYGDTIGFARKYGVVETARKSNSADDNAMSRSKKQNLVIKEKPGISPELLNKFLPTTAFMKVSDVASGLPDYTENVTLVDLKPDHLKAYREVENGLLSAFRNEIRKGVLGVIAKMLTVLTSFADNPVTEIVKNKAGKTILVCPDVPGVTAKEEMLVQIINENKQNNRKVLVYCEYTDTRDIQARLKDTLAGFDISSVILPGSIAPVKREEWIRKNTADTEVLICNPRLVSTGLDLYDFPTIVFYQTPYSTYLLRQASRRSWRIGQTKPVVVHFLVNSGTVQEKAMLLIANKMTASQIFEGEIPEEDGLAAISDIEEKSFIRRLAESLESGGEQMGSLDKMWKQKMKAQVKADDLLFAPQAEEEQTTTEVVIQKETKKETVVESNRGGKEKFVYTKISSVTVYEDKAASFTLDGQMYLMKDGNIYTVSGNDGDMNKGYAGKYIWQKSKKSGNKFAVCLIKGKNEKVYVGRRADTGEFVALKITKTQVA